MVQAVSYIVQYMKLGNAVAKCVRVDGGSSLASILHKR